MRLFIAIELNRAMLCEVKRVQRELIRLSLGGRFTPEDNFHITMHFIGESSDLRGAAAAMREAVRGIRPFPLSLGRYGSFALTGKRTAYVGVTDVTGELFRLHECLEAALADGGFSRDDKRFTPHITLGRSVACSAEAEEKLFAIVPSAAMEAHGITLFESSRTRDGMLYLPLHREKF